MNEVALTYYTTKTEKLETQWQIGNFAKLIYQSEKKRMKNYREHLEQVRELYKEIWDTEEVPEAVASKHGPAIKSSRAAVPRDDSDFYFKKALLPTSLMVVFFFRGITAPRRHDDDILFVIESFRHLWNVVFAGCGKRKFRTQKGPHSWHSFEVSVNTTVPMAIFPADTRDELANAWVSMWHELGKKCSWEVAEGIQSGSAVEVLLFLLLGYYLENKAERLPTHETKLENIQYVNMSYFEVHQWLRFRLRAANQFLYYRVKDVSNSMLKHFASILDSASRQLGQGVGRAIPEKDWHKNKSRTLASFDRRKQKCAMFLLKENEPCISSKFESLEFESLESLEFGSLIK